MFLSLLSKQSQLLKTAYQQNAINAQDVEKQVEAQQEIASI